MFAHYRTRCAAFAYCGLSFVLLLSLGRLSISFYMLLVVFRRSLAGNSRRPSSILYIAVADNNICENYCHYQYFSDSSFSQCNTVVLTLL